jgi:penicillin-binding protein 1C
MYGLKANEINNAAAIVVEVGSGNVLAYVGNVSMEDNDRHGGNFVDVIMASRSTGSILKPFSVCCHARRRLYFATNP